MSVLPIIPVRSWITVESEIWQRYQDAHHTMEIPSIPINEAKLADILTGKTELNISRPLILRGALNLTELGWDLDWLAASPRGDLVVDYFSDASIPATKGGSVPGARASIRDIVSAVRLENRSVYPKVGTEHVFRKFPDLLNALPLNDLRAVFGGTFDPWYIGSLLTVPVFLSRGVQNSNLGGSKIRTDLHCEPIQNLCLHLVGKKQWTLVDPADSKGLRPALAPDGRAYVFANLSPDDPAIRHVKRYSAMLEAGDILYVPTWWWHRVDYVEDETALSVSLFHVKFEKMVTNNWLYTMLVIPNMVKEVIGLNKQ